MIDPSLAIGLMGLLGQGQGGGQPFSAAQRVNDPGLTDQLMGAPNQQTGGVSIGQQAAASQAQPNPMAMNLMLQGLRGMGQQAPVAPAAAPAMIQPRPGPGLAAQPPMGAMQLAQAAQGQGGMPASLMSAYRERFSNGGW